MHIEGLFWRIRTIKLPGRLIFSHYVMSLLSLVIFFSLKSTLSDIYVATSTFRKLIFAWYAFSNLLFSFFFFQPFIFILPIPLNLKWCSYEQHNIVQCFCIHSAKPWSSHVPTPELIMTQENAVVWLARTGPQVWLHLNHLDQERELWSFKGKEEMARQRMGNMNSPPLPWPSQWPGNPSLDKVSGSPVITSHFLPLLAHWGGF